MRDSGKPERPEVPILFSGGLFFWIGMVAGTWTDLRLLLLFGISLAAVLSFVIGKQKELPQGTILALLLLFALLGLLTSSAWMYHVTTARGVLDQSGSAQGECVVMGDVSTTTRGYQALVQMKINGEAIRVLATFEDATDIGFGSHLIWSGKLSIPSDTSYLDSLGAVAQVSITSFQQTDTITPLALLSTLRTTCLCSISENWQLDADALALFDAIAFGYRTDLFASDLYVDVKICGLAHLVAVSGAHLAMVLGFVRLVLSRLRLSKRATDVVSGLIILGYLVVTAMPVSCIRAVIMVMLGMFAGSRGRRSSSLSALGVVMIVFLAFDPSVATSISFALSASATLGILLFMRYLVSMLSRLPLPTWLVESLAMTLAATIFTLALSAGSFNQLSLIAPFSNVVATPLLTYLVALALLAPLTVALPALATPYSWLAGAGSQTLSWVLQGLAGVPYASIPFSCNVSMGVLITIAVGFTWWLFWPDSTYKLLLELTVGLLLAYLCLNGTRWLVQGDDVVMLDVGQGDAILLESQGKRLLIDTGNQTQKLLSQLATEGVTHLDAVAITHADDDHCGCLSDLRGIVVVDQVLITNGFSSLSDEAAQTVVEEAKDLTGSDPIEIPVDSEFSVGRFVLKVISPEQVSNESDNASSLCMLASYRLSNGNTETALLVGDAERDTVKPLVSDGTIGHIDVLKVGHHGSRVSLDEELAQELSPEIALVSVGANNRYGHPTAECLNYLEDCGAAIFRTDQQGKVVCSFGELGIRVTCYAS